MSNEPSNKQPQVVNELICAFVTLVLPVGVMFWFLTCVVLSGNVLEAERQEGLPKIPEVGTLDFRDKVLKSDEPVLVWIRRPTDTDGMLPSNHHLRAMLEVMSKRSGSVKYFRMDRRVHQAVVSDLFDGNLHQLDCRDAFVIVRRGKVTARLVPEYHVNAVQLQYLIDTEAAQHN